MTPETKVTVENNAGPLKKINRSYRFFLSLLVIFCFVFAPSLMFGQAAGVTPEVGILKKMSVEELLNIEVTAVSKRPEKLTEVASAIQVITYEDIKRSGATSLPEAL